MEKFSRSSTFAAGVVTVCLWFHCPSHPHEGICMTDIYMPVVVAVVAHIYL